MTRHAKNSTAGSVYTYHEKQKDSSQSGYGSTKVRLGKDSMKNFDCCCLTLQPCRYPVMTKDGYLYDKEAILEYIVSRKRDIARKLKEFEKQKNKLQQEKLELGQAEKESQVKAFVQKEGSIVSKPIDPFAKKAVGAGAMAASASLSNMSSVRAKTLPSFWVPCLTPDAKASLVKKPDEKVRCPMSGQPLKLKDLMDITFTPIKDGDDKTAVISKDARYVCAVTNDVLGNSVPCGVLKTSGNVVTVECYEKIIKKDMIDPTNGKKMTEKDFLPLQRGATGFSHVAGDKLKAKKAGANMMA